MKRVVAGLLAATILLSLTRADEPDEPTIAPSLALARDLLSHLGVEPVACDAELLAFGTARDAVCARPGLAEKPLRKSITGFLKKRPEVTRLPASGRWVDDHFRVQRFFVERELFRLVYDKRTGLLALLPHQSCFQETLIAPDWGRTWTPALTPPELIEKVDALYPQAARNVRQDGFVMLQTLVSAEGGVTLTCALYVAPEGFGFREAALNAVRGYRYRPATREGKPLPFVINVSVVFQ